MAGISDDLRADLGKVFLLGYLDYSAGTPVEDTDEIPSALGPLWSRWLNSASPKPNRS